MLLTVSVFAQSLLFASKCSLEPLHGFAVFEDRCGVVDGAQQFVVFGIPFFVSKELLERRLKISTKMLCMGGKSSLLLRFPLIALSLYFFCITAFPRAVKASC